MSVTRLAFVRVAPPLNGWRLALLAAGFIALLPSCALWLRQANEIQRLEALLAQAQPRRAPQPALTPIQQRDLDQQTKAIAEAVRQLNLPVARLLKTLQAPADLHVALLGLDLNGQPLHEADAVQAGGAKAAPIAVPSGTIKIAAEAETAQDMLGYLAFLNQQQMFRSVYLVKHETASVTAGQAYRFQLEAQWRQ
ncbi:hypothetical protein ASD15_02230 [Massilia sp. Root351]|jgi:hypothetical protein|uniref:hypothetical protein n=1 Tax=Massilia sp. Root351 TaxID=1736522 RepID=UPI00070F995A|nr:hypothetical protein [Massilia sp. Root351]KQV90902.1 hypothetical protein ASD15_02230 [Massilia sp. Root351]